MLGIIIFVFAVNFGPWINQPSSNYKYIATIDNQIVSNLEFQKAYNQQVNLMLQTQPELKLDEQMQKKIKDTILQTLIAKSLIINLAEEQGLKISDKTLANYIKDKIFSKETWKNAEFYKRTIRSTFQLNENQFENQLRKDLLVEFMVKLIKKNASQPNNDQFLTQYIDFLKKNASIKINLD